MANDGCPGWVVDEAMPVKKKVKTVEKDIMDIYYFCPECGERLAPDQFYDKNWSCFDCDAGFHESVLEQILRMDTLEKKFEKLEYLVFKTLAKKDGWEERN